MSAKIFTTWEEHPALLRQVVGAFTDRRTGDNISFTMEDLLLVDPDGPAKPSRFGGLTAAYYKSANFRRENRIAFESLRAARGQGDPASPSAPTHVGGYPDFVAANVSLR